MPPERCVAFAPGRVNLIGEHTDYNDGLSLPFAIEQGVTVTATRTAGGADEVVAVALDRGESDRFDRADPAPAQGWRAFVRGAVAELQAAGHAVPAARLEITGSVPEGSGLSSSAALEVALCLALLGLAGEDAPDRLALARVCSKVENDRVGAQTGLLDQIASLFGRERTALRVDFRSLDVAAVPLDIGDWTLVTADSGEQHSIAESGYNERRRECREAADLLGVRSLRDLDGRPPPDLPGAPGRRVRHVLEENVRVDATVEALRDGDLERVARLLDASHASLRDLYEASTPAVERTVDDLKAAGAAGARMMGGGFGGHILALLPPGVAPPDRALTVAPAAGARVLDASSA